MKKIVIVLFSLIILTFWLFHWNMGPMRMLDISTVTMQQTACHGSDCVSGQTNTDSSNMQCLQHCLSSKQIPVNIFSVNTFVFFVGLFLFLLLRNLIQTRSLSTTYFRQAISKLLLRRNLATVILLD